MTSSRDYFRKQDRNVLSTLFASPCKSLALPTSYSLFPTTCLLPTVPMRLKPTHSVCYWGQLTLLSPVMVPTKQAGQRSRMLTRLRKSRSGGLSRSAFDSWYSAPQISRAFSVGSPSCTSMRKEGRKRKVSRYS